MSMTLEELKVIINAEIAPFKKKMQEAVRQTKSATAGIEKQAASIKNIFSKIAKFASFAIIGRQLLKLGMYSTQMALEVSAAMNQIKRQMGESSQAFLKWINDNANAMNMSVADATKFAGVYSNLFSGFIKDSEKLSAYTGKMLQTSAVIAEGTGRSITDVMERIRSGLLGNTEAIEDLGINVNVAMIESTEAFKRFANGQAWQELDYQTQQQIRLLAILEQASAKYGDTLSNSVNGRISLFKSLLKDAALNIGNSFLPIVNAVMPVLNSLALVLKNVTAKLAEFVGLMFNKKATVKDGAVGSANQGMKDLAGGAGDVADALGDADDATGGLADNLDDTAKSAKKAVKELLGLAGFDEITTLKQKDDSDSDSSPKSPKGGGGKGKKGKGGGSPFKDILPEIGLEDMDNQFKSIFDGLGDKSKGLFDYFKKLSNLFKKGFNLSFRHDSINQLKKALEGIGKSIRDIFEDGVVFKAAAGFGEKLAFALGQGLGAVANVIMGIAVFIAESLNKSLNETKLDIREWLIRQFYISGDIVASLGNIAQVLGQMFYDTFTSSPATNIGSDLVSMFTYAYIGISDVLGKLARDHIAGIERILTDNQERFTKFFTGILSAAEPIFNSLKDMVKDFMSGWNDTYNEHFKPFIDGVYEGISKITGILLDSWQTYIQPVLEKFGKGFETAYQEHIKPAIESMMEALGSFYDLLKALWDNVLEPFYSWIAENILPILAPIVDFLLTNVIETIKTLGDIVNTFFKVLQGLLEFLTGVFSGDWDRAWNGIAQVFNAIWEGIGNFLSRLWEGIVSDFQKWWDDIKKAFEPAGQWFTQKFKEAWTGLTNIFSGIGSWFGQRWSDVTSVLSNVANWFGDIFRRAYDSVRNAFSSIGSFFSGVWQTVQSIFVNAGQAVGDAVGGAFRGAVNAVLGTIENVVNGFIDMINGVIGIINALPGVSLGYIGGVNLPRLARGGIVDGPTVAMIGEAGKEVVMPLENTGFLQTMGRIVGGAVVNALGGGLPQSQGFAGNGDIVINIGGHELGRIAIKEINAEQERAGQILLNI